MENLRALLYIMF